MNNPKTIAGRVLATVGAASLVLAGLAGSSAAAFATDSPVGPDQPGAPDSGSLTIHKLVGDQGAAGDGTEQTVSGEPLADVEFTLWQLGTQASGSCTALDLTDSDAWDSVPTSTAPATTAGVESAGFCLLSVAGQSATTDADGELVFSGLDLGLYYVQETDAPSNVVSTTAPFYVTVPLPNEDGSWIYDVHTYPKNQIADAPSKTINETDAQSGLSIGSTVEWTISQSVPKLNDGESYTSASLWDDLNASLGDPKTVSVTLDGVALVEGTDYTVAVSGQKITWTLTASRLASLQAGQVLETTFTTVVNEVTGDGSIANGPENYGSEFNGTSVPPETTPYTYWGALQVKKVDGNAKALAGAEFQVFAQTAGACAAEAPASGAVATGTSGSDGLVRWAPKGTTPIGLFVANSNNGPLTDAAKVYCLYETKVPAGYTGAAVQTVTITAGNTLTAGANDLTVKNVQKDGPELPLTGAQGTALLTVGGIALLATGAVVYFVSRRKRTQH